MTETVRLDASDTVVTAIRSLEVGVQIDGFATQSLIPRGHKIATEAMAKGAPVRKYAQIIGYASEDISAGAHVHTHNVEFRNTDLDYEFSTDLRPITPAAASYMSDLRVFQVGWKTPRWFCAVPLPGPAYPASA